MPINDHQNKDDLQTELEKSIADLDKPENQPEAGIDVPNLDDTPDEAAAPAEDTPAESVDAPDTEDVPEIKADAPDDTPIEPGKDDVVPEEKPKPTQTVEDRYKESTKEAQKLYKNNAEMNKAIAEANEMPEPTEEELKARYSNWDEMDELTKDLAKETFMSKRFRDHINQASAQQRSIEEWGDKVTKYSDDPQTLIDHPELEGKVNQFNDFASTKENKGVPFTILVSAFLHDLAKNPPTPKKGKMLETPSGGPNDAPKVKPQKLTVEQGATLMRTDYKKYKQYLLAGKIEMPS